MLTWKEAIKLWHELNEPNTDPHQTVPEPGQSIRYNGQFYNFAELIELYGSLFVINLIIIFIDACGEAPSSTNVKRNQALRSFLRQIACDAISDPAGQAARVHTALVEGQVPDEKDFNWVVDRFSDRARNFANTEIITSKNKTYRATFLESVSGALRLFAQYDLWPLVKPIRRIDDRGAGRIKTLGELGPGNSTVTYEGEDSLDRTVNSCLVRMAAVRRVAEAVFVEGYARFQEGRRLMNLPTVADFPTIEDAISKVTDYARSPRQHPLVEMVFPKDNDELRLANLLIFIKIKFGGVIPARSIVGELWRVGRIITAVGGVDFVSSHFEGARQTLFAGQLIVLIDSGMNVQPCDDMPVNPFYGEIKRGSVTLTTLTSTKTRPAPKDIVVAIDSPEVAPKGKSSSAVPSDDLVSVPVAGAEAQLKVDGAIVSSVDVIKQWQEMSERLRLRADEAVKPYLWICAQGTGNDGKIKRLGEGAKSQLDIMRRRFELDPILSGLKFSRKNIRPTWIMIKASRNMTDYALIQEQSSHNSAGTTFGIYLNRQEYKSQLDRLIRRFQHQLEAAILITDVSRISHLAVDVATVTSRAEEAIKNGLDEILFDAENYRSEVISKIDEESNLPERFDDLMNVSPNEDDIVTLLLLKWGLEASEQKFIEFNPQRWQHVWMDGLALVTAAAARIEDSRYKPIYVQACRRAEEGLEQGRFRVFVPW